MSTCWLLLAAIDYYHCLIMTGSHNKYRTLKAIEELILQHMDQNDFEEAQRVLA